MSDYRIVFNKQTGRYRVEKRGWAGWSFVTAERGGDYLTFDSCEAARRFICARRRPRRDVGRRWQVVDLCHGERN
jgi:hypothetical protein